MSRTTSTLANAIFPKNFHPRACKVSIENPLYPTIRADRTCSGGPAGLIYGYIFVWIGTLSIFLTLAEATSM